VCDVLVSDAFLSYAHEHLIKRWAHETPGQSTWGFHDPHAAKLDMLRSQMLYPLSYERWEMACDLRFYLNLVRTPSKNSI
jgi:hypothetical protein